MSDDTKRRDDEAAADDGGDEVFSAQAIVDALGGTRGLLEASIPGVVFAMAYAITGARLAPSLWAAVGSAVLILVVAVAQRRSVQQTISGFIGILVAAGIVLITGRARDFFLVSLWRNALWLAAHSISLLVRWPLVGVLLGPFTGEGTAWRKDRRRYRAYMWCTLIWVAVFGIRLAVQLPLFAEDDVVALGVVGVFLGVPLFLVACALNFLILVRVPLAKKPESSSDGTDRGDDDDGGDGVGGDTAPSDGPSQPHPPIISPG